MNTNHKLSVITSYLERSAPAVAAALKKAHPRSAKIFSSDLKLGPAETSEPLTPEKRTALLALIAATGERAKVEITEVAEALRLRMMLVRRLRLVGGLVASISGATAAAVGLSQMTEKGLAAWSSVVSMVGGIVTVFAEHFEQAPSGRKVVVADELAELVQMLAEVETTLLRIAHDALKPLTEAELNVAVDMFGRISPKLLALKYLSA